MNYPKRLSECLFECEYWELSVKNSLHQIQWTPEIKGVVRAKLDSIAEWGYKPCYDIRFAKDVGMAIINNQKKDRETNEFLLYGYDPNYQGA
jgi:hypothetical protein